MRIPSAILTLLLVGACTRSEQPVSKGGAPAVGPAVGTIADLDADIAAVAARPEQGAPRVEVQHVLIAFQGAPRITGVTRTLDEAHQLAAEVYARAKAGEDFTALMKEFSNDSGPGIYPMDQETRRGMVQAFGDVSWRLAVGEIGVTAYDPGTSKFGWHIIKRLK